MTRQTSINVYRQIESEGLLSKMRWVAYEYLYKHGPATSRQVHAGVRMFRDVGVASSRLAELVRIGCVSEVGVVNCDVTGREVLLFDVNKNIPIDLIKKTNESKRVLAEREVCARIADKWAPAAGIEIRNRGKK